MSASIYFFFPYHDSVKFRKLNSFKPLTVTENKKTSVVDLSTIA